ncbi:MAG: PBSX family phage terminase large subunit [Bryobacteraceae bacterium]
MTATVPEDKGEGIPFGKFPAKLRFLFKPARYKVAWGGRGAAKSWGFARALLIQGRERRLRWLCARETQQSIADSVHQLLKMQIEDLGLAAHYVVKQAEIVGRNGTEFLFAGLRHDISKIKSVEACDGVWVEEAQNVSRHSWEVLIPTIRKDGSEIWVTFNPDLDTDDTYKRFVINPPPGAAVVRMTYRDNPWFPEVLRREARLLAERDPDAYQHVWEGCCISTLEGGVYAKELRLVDQEQRITRVPYDPTKPVHTFWDLGWGDSTAIWFAQAYAFEYRLIDYLEGSQEPLKHYLKLLQERPYVYGTDYLPHDAKAKQLGSGRSIEELMREAGRKVEIVAKLSVNDGINAARTIFPLCWFDADKCADGVQALRHYRFGEKSEDGRQMREPLHDWSSHAADAFRYFAVGMRPPEQPERETADEFFEGRFTEGRNQSWMG